MQTDELDQVVARLRAMGISVTDIREQPGARYAMAEGPDGVLVEIFEPDFADLSPELRNHFHTDYAIPRSNPKALNRSPIESRDPDPVAFDEAYRRLRDVSVRMQLRVSRDDVLHAPVQRAVIACSRHSTRSCSRTPKVHDRGKTSSSS